MFRCGALVLKVGVGGGLCCAVAQAESSVVETRTTVEKWVEARQLISKEKSNWQTDRSILEQSIELFRKELERIKSQIEEAESAESQAGKERQQLLEENEQLIAASRRLVELVTDLEDRIRDLATRLPGPLIEKIEPFLNRLPDDAATTKMSASQRMQNVVGILNEVEKFNGSFSVVSEIRKNDAGKEIQVKTLYAGLGQAYFVDASGEYAGVGVPTPAGWEWRSVPEISPRIAQAIAVFENTQSAAFVSLPVEIK